MQKPKKILAFAREAGGAAAIAPVFEAMQQEGWDVLLLGKDYGLDFFKRQNLTCVDFSSFDLSYLNALVNERFGSLPGLIFTSAASLPTLDMTEKYLWRWGQKNRILTVGVLDQWQNYALRFSGPSENERLAYLPKYIFVMDELAKEEMIKEEIPPERIVVTGQPAFDKIKEEHKILSLKVDKIKDGLNIPNNFTIITFAAESLKKDFGDRLGYDEQSILQFLGDTLDRICAQTKELKLYLLIKLHPENRYEEFNWLLCRWPSLKKEIIGKELRPCEIIAVSDIVIGMSSIILVEAILTNKITISLQINSRIDSQLVATKVGAIPFVKTRDEARRILDSLVHDKAYREKYLQNQLKWEINKNGTGKCINMLKTILGV